MEYRTLGRTGLKVSLMSFGTGGPSSLGKSGGLSEAEQDRLLQRCLELGVNFFDSSERYGDSESIIGRALDGVPRDSYVLATKWRHDPGGKLADDPQELAASVERSLHRLRTDYIDIMQFHGLIASQYHEVVERFYPVMERLREQGKIRFTGFSSRFFADPAHEAASLAMNTHPELWDTLMLKYGILNSYAAKDVFPKAQAHGVGILNMAAVRFKLPNPRLLEETIADWKQRGLIASDSVPDKNPLDWLIHDEADSVISAAYKFAADHPAVSTVLTGTINIRHLEANARALENPRLPDGDKNRVLELFGDIADYA